MLSLHPGEEGEAEDREVVEEAMVEEMFEVVEVEEMLEGVLVGLVLEREIRGVGLVEVGLEIVLEGLEVEGSKEQ